jgi:RimJ/RimL family protein N-acetyltransferase
MLTLETERLIIRNFRPDDWQELQALAIAYQASEWAQYDHPWPTSEEKVKGMAEWFAQRDGYLAVCLKSSGALIGLLNIHHKQEAEGRVHGLGYVFHPDHHGRGYATEACRAGLDQVFGPWEADRIETGTHPDNAPSVRLLSKLGLRETGRGEYAISRQEWLARQGS